MGKGSLALTTAVFLTLLGTASAFATTASLYFDGADSKDAIYWNLPTPSGPQSVYAGPYDFNINGKSPEVPMYCDDATHDIENNESWIANVWSGVTLSNAMWYNTYSTTQPLTVTTEINGQNYTATATSGTVVYEAMFYLTYEEMGSAANSNNGPNSMAELQAAIWGVGYNPILTADNAAAYDLYEAIETVENPKNAALDNFLLSDFQVYRWDGNDLTVSGGTPPPQEFIRYVPEPCTPLFLGLTLLILGGAITFKAHKTHA
jgi:hypothetical protein